MTMPETDRRRDTIIRLPEVMTRTGLKRTTLYRLIKLRAFPAQVAMSPNCVGWYLSEVEAWIADPTGYAPPFCSRISRSSNRMASNISDSPE